MNKDKPDEISKEEAETSTMSKNLSGQNVDDRGITPKQREEAQTVESILAPDVVPGEDGAEKSDHSSIREK